MIIFFIVSLIHNTRQLILLFKVTNLYSRLCLVYLHLKLFNLFQPFQPCTQCPLTCYQPHLICDLDDKTYQLILY